MRMSHRLALHLPVIAQVMPIAALVLVGCRSDLPPASMGDASTGDDGDDGGGGSIDAEWSFHDVNTIGQLSPSKSCPPGFNKVALHILEVDADHRPIGPEIIHLFACNQFAGSSTPLTPGVYETFIVVTTDATDGSPAVYATSPPAIVVVTTSNKPFKAQIVDNGGYFKLGWDLRRQATNAPLACPDLIAGQDRIKFTATLIANPSIFFAKDFGCEIGEAFSTFSGAVPLATYDVLVEPINSQGAPIGPGVVVQDRIMGDRSTIVDLGIFTLSFP